MRNLYWNTLLVLYVFMDVKRVLTNFDWQIDQREKKSRANFRKLVDFSYIIQHVERPATRSAWIINESWPVEFFMLALVLRRWCFSPTRDDLKKRGLLILQFEIYTTPFGRQQIDPSQGTSGAKVISVSPAAARLFRSICTTECKTSQLYIAPCVSVEKSVFGMTTSKRRVGAFNYAHRENEFNFLEKITLVSFDEKIILYT